jgi:hypothetical protein
VVPGTGGLSRASRVTVSACSAAYRSASTPPIEWPSSTAGSADDLVDEAAQHGQVGGEPAATGGNAAAAVPEQVDGVHPAGGGEQRGEQPPVEC